MCSKFFRFSLSISKLIVLLKEKGFTGFSNLGFCLKNSYSSVAHFVDDSELQVLHEKLQFVDGLKSNFKKFGVMNPVSSVLFIYSEIKSE